MSKAQELSSEREQLWEKWTTLDSFNELLEFQFEVVNSIRQCERELPNTQDKNILHFHISRLRLYMDGIAWRIVHPHTIRQLANNKRSTPPSIEGQGKAFDRVLEAARNYFDYYQVPVFISDITNVLKIGDLVVCVSRETPILIECKSSLPAPRHLMQGRVGRQLSRATGTLEYLRTGKTKIMGETEFKQTVESPHLAKRNWDVVSEVCQKASENGYALHNISEHEIIAAYAPGNSDTVYRELEQSKRGDVFLGTSLGLMNMDDGLFPPPSAWPILKELRHLMLEEKIILCHFIDSRAFEQQSQGGDSITISLQNSSPITVRVNDTEYQLTRRFIYDVLYGFETVDSCVKGMIDFVHQINAGALLNIPNISTNKPTIHHLESEQDILLMVSSNLDGKSTFVSMPAMLAEQILHHSSSSSKDLGNLDLTTILPAHAYAVITLDALREAVKSSDSGNL